MRTVILVNGVPASGKSTVVRALRAHFPSANSYEMDAVKEPFMDAFMPTFGKFEGHESLKLSRACSQAIWNLIGTSSAHSFSIVDSWVQENEREILQAALAEAEIARLVEIWCEADPEVVVQRYIDRVPHRHAGHTGAEFEPILREAIANGAPIGVGALVRVHTQRDDVSLLPDQVRTLLETEQARLLTRPSADQ